MYSIVKPFSCLHISVQTCAEPLKMPLALIGEGIKIPFVF